MKKTIITLAALAFAVAAHAQSTGANSSAQTQSTAQNGSLIYAPHTNETSTVRYDASSAFAPPLVATSPCAISTGIGATGASFGVSIGSVYSDKQCQRLQRANALRLSGQPLAAIAEICSDDQMAYDLMSTGGYIYRRQDGSAVRLACPLSYDAWAKAGKPLLDPETGLPIASGAVVVAAPPPKPVTVSSVDQLGVKTTITSVK
jgi:hypothetical protein